jgi:uncharacterized protein YjbI with pentapeptide repeats
MVWWPWLPAGAASVVTLGAWWLWWRLPKRQIDRLRLTIRDPKARADVEDNFRKTIGQLLAGAAVLIGAALAYLQFTQQQKTSHEQLLQQEQASRDLLISNQVSKGFEQLGNDKSVVPLGGIYALEGVMNTSEQYRRPVLEALSAFVRDGTKTETGEGPPATDIQAALTVIGRRAKFKGRSSNPDLAKAHIPKADLPLANLTGANLTDANLIGADLSAGDLSSADLTRADLSGAYLISADLTRGANLTSAHLLNAELRGARLIGADLTNAHLTNADLTNADLTNAQYLTQEQLDKACGTGVKGLDTFSPPLTIKPCLPQ